MAFPREEGSGKVLVSLIDITGHKQAAEEIQKLNEALRDRATALEAANQELKSFSYSVSHDLRAPLRAIDGFSQALLDDYSAKLDEEGKHYLQRVRAAAQRMGQLIDDLLELSRVTRGELRMEPVNLSNLAQEVAVELARRDPGRKVVFAIAPGVAVTGDARFLRVALENLLGNAWKFTSRRPKATIEFGVTEQEGQPVYFLRDNGAGFDTKYAGKLFGAFQRLHTLDEFPGTGVGLATVQRIIHRHSGRIWAEGKEGAGATFYFTLPTDPKIR
jgi:light-regulated signal transduction histidine kinase (bacteriophytochrome)